MKELNKGKPEQCHRSKLIAADLVGKFKEVAHINENDQLISQTDVMLRLSKGQPSLFSAEFQQLTSPERYKES